MVQEYSILSLWKVLIRKDDSKIIYLGLPGDENFEYFVSVDKNGNMLIPKEGYDEDLDLF